MKFRVKTTAETYYTLMGRLRANEPFVYTRYGDGELEIMLGGAGGGQLPNEALAKETWELFHLHSARNLLGLARHDDEPGMTKGLFEAWKDPKYKFSELPQVFENAVPLHYLAVFKPHLLAHLFQEIAPRPKLYVGALEDPALKELLGEYTHVRVPEYNAYDTIDEWYAVIEQLVPAYPLVLFAAGPAKCAAALRLLKSGAPVQAIDLGSVVDLLLGVQSRTWIKMAMEGKV